MNRLENKKNWLVISLLWIALLVFSQPGFSEQTTDGLTEESPFAAERLRDPFWPLGFYPEGWQAGVVLEEESGDMGAGSDWEAPARKLIVSGTSRMDGKSVAIINGKLVSSGELIEVSHNGRVYQWRLRQVKPNGKIDLERVAIKGGGLAF